RRMDVEQPCAVRPRVRKRMDGSDRRGDERAGAETERFAADKELGLAVEHVEGVDVIVVAVRVRSHEARLELELDQGELFAPDLDGRNPRSPLEPFPVARPEEDGVGSRGAASGRRIEAVEASRLSAISCLQISCESAVRSVEVEEASGRRGPEAVDDL